MQRMQREERGDREARPERPRHASKDREKQQGIREVERDVHQVMGAGIEPEQLHVEHV